MRAFDKRQPNVKSLVRKGDVDGLIAAAAYTEFVSGPEGTPIDVGAPIREEALRCARGARACGRRVCGGARRFVGPGQVRRHRGAVRARRRRWLADAVAGIPVTAGRARGLALRALFELHAPGSSRRLAHALVHKHDNLPLSDEDEALVPALVRTEGRPEALAEVVNLLISALVHESTS